MVYASCKLQKIFRGFQKLHSNFSRLHGSVLIDQNVQTICSEILIPFLSFSDNLLKNAYTTFHKTFHWFMVSCPFSWHTLFLYLNLLRVQTSFMAINFEGTCVKLFIA